MKIEAIGMTSVEDALNADLSDEYEFGRFSRAISDLKVLNAIIDSTDLDFDRAVKLYQASLLRDISDEIGVIHRVIEVK